MWSFVAAFCITYFYSSYRRRWSCHKVLCSEGYKEEMTSDGNEHFEAAADMLSETAGLEWAVDLDNKSSLKSST